MLFVLRPIAARRQADVDESVAHELWGSWAGANSLLLELVGKRDKAIAALELNAGYCCCYSQYVCEGYAFASSIRQRQGRYKEALEFQVKAMEKINSWDDGCKSLYYLRLAYLTEKAAHRPMAPVEYQLLVDLFPKTESAAIARRRLLNRKMLAQPTADRSRTYLDDRDLDGFAVKAIRTHRFQNGVDLLCEGLVRGDIMVQGACAKALAEIGDRRAVPVLRKVAAGNDAKDTSLTPRGARVARG